MNASRVQELERGLNGIAKKVLDAVPISEAWTIAQVCAEIHRCGSTPDYRIVEGCLKKLHDIGLVRRHGDSFMRSHPKPRIVLAKPATQPSTSEPTMPSNVPIMQYPANAAVDPLAKLADAAKALRSMASTLGDVATAVEDAALAFAEQRNREAADAEKLRQLRALIGGL